MTTLDLSQFDQRWVERRIRGRHCPNWVAHWRIRKVLREWQVLEPGQLEGIYERQPIGFDTFEEARAHVADKVTQREYLHATTTVYAGGKAPAWIRALEAVQPSIEARTWMPGEPVNPIPNGEPVSGYTLAALPSRWCFKHSLSHVGPCPRCTPYVDQIESVRIEHNPLLDQSQWALMGDMFEMRTRPLSEVLRGVLNDANLSIESPFLDPEQCPNDDIRCSCPVDRGHRA